MKKSKLDTRKRHESWTEDGHTFKGYYYTTPRQDMESLIKQYQSNARFELEKVIAIKHKLKNNQLLADSPIFSEYF